MNRLKIALTSAVTSAFLAGVASGATIYVPGNAPAAGVSGLTFGAHLVGGPLTSVAGVGGSGLSAAGGSTLDGQRTYIYDQGVGAATDLADGIANRGDAGFAMMIWNMGAAFDSMRLYTHQDHYSGGPITTTFVAQDVMEYSVWGSNDGNNFVLLSDVTAFNLTGEGVGLPTYTFNGTAPTVVYRGGSSEFGALNAYTREYQFGTAYQYYGIRTSSVSLFHVPIDADPEIDAIAGFNARDRGVPDGGSSILMLGLGLVGLAATRRILGGSRPAGGAN